MPIRPNDRVTLRNAPGYAGTVHAVHGDVAVVFGDSGWSGKYEIADLVPEASKSWPPSLETK